jgi:UDP-glucose 4-epimerase
VRHVLVTGGNGFIGQYVCEELERRGYDVDVLERRGDATEYTPRHVVFGDIRDAVLVDEAISHVEGVIHLAGVLGTQETIADPTPAASTNILGGLNVITSCAKHDVPLVNIGVGNYWMNNTYSITKHTVERLVEMTHRFRGARMTTVRALNAYGPRQVPAEPYGPSRVRKILPSFICRALSGDPIEIYGDGEQVMDMIHVRDLARILATTLQWVDLGIEPATLVEAGTGRETTVNQIAGVVIDAAGRGEIVHLPMRPGEDERSVVKGDPETLAGISIDPASLISLEVGVKETVEHYRAYLAR